MRSRFCTIRFCRSNSIVSLTTEIFLCVLAARTDERSKFEFPYLFPFNSCQQAPSQPLKLYRDLDFDLNFLKDALHLVDGRIDQLEIRAESEDNPDQEGSLDNLNYFAGFGFVACQVYFSWHISHANLRRRDALDRAPIHRCGVSIVALINAAANMWKHDSEWWNTYQSRDLGVDARRTMETLQTLGVDPRGQFAAANCLWEIAKPHSARFASLVPFLERWKEDLYE